MDGGGASCGTVAALAAAVSEQGRPELTIDVGLEPPRALRTVRSAVQSLTALCREGPTLAPIICAIWGLTLAPLHALCSALP